jgi:hypothetical protein
VNLERFANLQAQPRTLDVPVPELAGWGLYDEGEPLVWRLRSLTALEFHQAATAHRESMRRLREALDLAVAGSEEAAGALRAAAEATPAEFSQKIEILSRASVSPLIGEAHRDVVVRLSELLPELFFRLANLAEGLFAQGADPGKAPPSGSIPA